MTDWDEGAIVGATEAIAMEIRRLGAMGARQSGLLESFDDFSMDRWARPAWAELSNERHDVWLLGDPEDDLPGVLVAVRDHVVDTLGRGMLVGPASGRWDGPGTLLMGLALSDATLAAMEPGPDGLTRRRDVVTEVTPLSGGVTWLPGASAPELVTAVETAIRARLATYVRCTSCGLVKPPEWGGELCYACMQERGVVF